MELIALGGFTKIGDNTYYFAINYAALASSFLVYSKDGSNVEINGQNLQCHNRLVRLPLTIDDTVRRNTPRPRRGNGRFGGLPSRLIIFPMPPALHLMQRRCVASVMIILSCG